MEKKEMNEDKKLPSRWFYGIAVLIVLFGLFISVWIMKDPGLGKYPAMIADAYHEEQHHLNVPGSRDVELTRSGAYGIYFEYSLVNSARYPNERMPPSIDCSLVSKSTGAEIEAAPDYVDTNRYWSKGHDHTGVLIMSITVDKPDTFRFACQYQDGSTEPEIVVALGPNYIWEFLRVAWEIGLPMLGGISILCGSLLLALITVVVVAIIRRRNISLLPAASLIFFSLLLYGCGAARFDNQALPTCSDSDFSQCTIFTVSQGERVFFGGNGDWVNFDSNYYWVDPGSDTSYGAIYFGVPENVQQGFNEKGLAYDANGVPIAPVKEHPGREPVYGSYASYSIQILQECATVEEVIEWVQEHQWHEQMHDQLHFADATGDAVVISAGPDGKVAFTRKPQGDSFLVSTNFNLANPSTGSYPCWRYDRAEELLKDIDNWEDLTAERAASVLDAVHVESATSWTIMSVVGDLPRGLVYVYLFHQFDAPIVLDVAEEIAGDRNPGPLRDLFPPETLNQVDQAYQRLMERSVRCNLIGLTWLGLVALSLAALFFLARSRSRELKLWMPVVAVLGPIGLLVWLIAGRDRRSHTLVETVGDLPPYVVGTVVAFLTIILVPRIEGSILLQTLVFYVLPLTIGLFLFQAPLLTRATRSSYGRIILRRLPSVIVSTNLVLAGLLAVYLPLIKLHLNYCGFSVATLLSWWAIAVLGAFVGGLLLCIYHAWAVRCGFAAWSALLWGTSETDDGTITISSPSWRRLWLWIIVSYVVLVAGMALGR
jgi:hypothetical protein